MLCNRKIIIIGDPYSHNQLRAGRDLSWALHSEYSLECRIWTVQEAASLPDRHLFIYIFLLETERPVLYDMTEELYQCLQHLLKGSQSVFWISAGRGSSLAEDPAYGMVDGLSRTLRNETPEQLFVNIALEIREGVTKEHIQSII